MRVGSLFSGIGGLDLGLERAGMTVAWQSEIDEYACRVLAKHWPDVPNLGDITKIDWKDVPRVDLICGGYPCQPFSFAGRRAGEDDERHLWPYVADAIRVLRPRFALLENVPGHLALGFGRVLGDLAEIGYDVEWDCIPASAVGAPHRRDRVFIVAHPRQSGLEGGWLRRAVGHNGGARHMADPEGERRGQGRRPGTIQGDQEHGRAQVQPRGRGSEVSDANNERLEGSRLPEGKRSSLPDLDRGGSRVFGRPPQPGEQWATEPDVGRVADGISSRVDRLRALGNAVVPAVAEHIGRRLMEIAA